MKKRAILWFLVPVSVVYLGLYMYPALNSIFVSFFDWSGFGKKMAFIGFSNYKELFRDPLFIQSLKNTGIYMVFGGILLFILVFSFTYVLLSGVRFKKFFRAIIFLPNIIALIALASIWTYIYNPNFGLLNGFLRAIGLDILTRPWMAPDRMIWAVIVAIVWIQAGFFTIILLSGAEKIPPSYYEAAALDGANRFKRFFSITIPLIWEELRIAVSLWLILSIKMFEFIYAFGSVTTPPTNMWTGTLYMYILAFGKRVTIYRLGYASSVAVALLILIIIAIVVTSRIFKREAVEY